MSVLSFSRLQARIWGYEKPHSLTPAEDLIYEADKRMKKKFQTPQKDEKNNSQ